MEAITKHLRNKILAGAFAAVPAVVIVYGAILLEQHTSFITEPLGWHFPGLGVLAILLGVYLLGLIVTSLVGKFVLRIVDKALARIPGFSLLYRSYKDILVTDPEGTGVFDRAVLAPNPEGKGYQIGFTSGKPIASKHLLETPALQDTNSNKKSYICVFLPGVPNPIVGRLVVVQADDCYPISIPPEEAFKFLLSSGNYVPEELYSLSGAAAPLQ